MLFDFLLLTTRTTEIIYEFEFDKKKSNKLDVIQEGLLWAPNYLIGGHPGCVCDWISV
jgi:hypothetical protein